MLDGARHGERHNAVVILLHAATTVMAAAFPFCLSTARVTKRGTGDCFIEISQAGQRCEACCFAPPFPPSDPEQIYPDQGALVFVSHPFFHVLDHKECLTGPGQAGPNQGSSHGGPSLKLVDLAARCK